MQKCVRLTPLTNEERIFSEENYPVLEWCIRVSGLEKESSDLAYLAYLHAVKKWHARPELRKWSFKTIVKQTLRSYISNEHQKASRRIQAVSLEEVIPGTDGLTWADTITEDNVKFLKAEEGEGMEEKRKISYDVKIPEKAYAGGRLSVDTELLINFLEDAGHKTMCIEYADAKTATMKSGVLRKWKKNKHREDFKICRFQGKVFVEKIAKGAK